MDKYEYRLKIKQMVELVEKKDYRAAVKIADTIDWHRVKSVSMLCTVSEIYEKNKRYAESRDILLIAYDRAPIGRSIVYKLAELALKMGDLNEAVDCYEEFVHIAPRDSGRYVLEYRILRKKGAPLNKQIAALEQFKKVDYNERWVYELARLYEEDGRLEECVNLCDELALWFSDGEYVIRALELKSKYRPLTAIQQETYRQWGGFGGTYEEPAAEKFESADFRKPAHQSEHTGNAWGKASGMREESRSESFRLPEQEEKIRTIYIPDEVLHPEKKQKQAADAKRQGLFDRFFGRDREEKEYVSPVRPQADAFVGEPDDDEMSYEPEFEVPPVNVGKFDTMNLQAELAKNMAEIFNDDGPRRSERADFASEEEKKREALLHAQTKEISDDQRQGKLLGNTKEFVLLPKNQPSLARQKPRKVKDFREVLSEDYDGQISLFIEESKMPEKQITGQMNLEGILAEWKKTKQETERAIEKAAKKQAEESRRREPVAPVEPKISGEIRDLLDELEEESQDSLWSLRGREEQGLGYKRAAFAETDEEQAEGKEAQPFVKRGATWDPDREPEPGMSAYERKNNTVPGVNVPAGSNVYTESPAAAVERSLTAAAEALEKAVALGKEFSSQKQGKNESEEFGYEETGYEEPEFDYEENGYEESGYDYEEPDYEETKPYYEEAGYEESYGPVSYEEDLYEESYEGEPYGEAYGEDSYADEPCAEESYEEEPYGEEFYGEEPYEEEPYEEEPYEEEPYEEEPYEEEPYEEEPYEEEPYEDEPYDEEPYEEELYGEAYGEDSYAEEPYEEEPYGEEPYEEEPYGEEPYEEELYGGAYGEDSYAGESYGEEPYEEEPYVEEPYEDELYAGGSYAEQSDRERLTDSQRRLFSYFMSVRGMEERLASVIYDDVHNDTRNGTSRNGNILVIGRPGAGKTTLAVNLVKAIQRERNMSVGKLAKVTGETLNRKNIDGIVDKVYGGALLIEQAGMIDEQTASDLAYTLKGDTGELLVLLEDGRKPLTALLERSPDLAEMFTSRLEVPVFMNDELVAFGETYAGELGYKIEDMGILALYSRIDELQREDHAVTVGEVGRIVDEAIARSERGGIKKVMGSLFKKRKDDNARKLLLEQDFGVK